MTFAIDFGAMDDVITALRSDHSAIAGQLVHATPSTGIAGFGGDPGQSWVARLNGEADTGATWLEQRVRAVRGIVDDVHAIDGAEGERYARIRDRLHDSIAGPLTRESLDDRLGRHSRIHHSEEGF